MKKILSIVLASATLFLITPRAYADYRAGAIQTGVGFGMTTNSARPDFELVGEFFLYDDISLGLNLDFYVGNSTSFLSTVFGRYHIDIKKLPELTPYIGLGLGFGVHGNGSGTLEIELPNFGFWYELTDKLFIGPSFATHINTNFSRMDWDLTLIFAEIVYRF